MSKRSGPFWDGVEGRAPLPRAAATLGLEVLEIDPDQGTIELAFAGKEDFTTPRATCSAPSWDQARSAA
jgi:hypothetical protein